uniref:Uncharacterized protein n=1 Tax=Arundo donax TaxID=35708 RepID=A0A0A8ZH31_ARUDO
MLESGNTTLTLEATISKGDICSTYKPSNLDFCRIDHTAY